MHFANLLPVYPPIHMKKIFKQFYKNIAFRKAVCWLITYYIKLVYYTSRKHIIMSEEAKPYVSGEKVAVFAFWHGRLLMMSMVKPKNRKMNVLISTHRDGEIISLAMENFGLGTIRGSSTRGGSSAAIRCVKALQMGENVCITPDGPKGPAMQAQPGILSVAAMAQVPIIYATYSSSLHKKMKSWDRFMVALPFGTLYYKAGLVDAGSDVKHLENLMKSATEDVDRLIFS